MQKLIVTSPSFEHEGLIPEQHTGYGADHSPELNLRNIDTRAKSLAILMDDLGHPIPAYSHWVIWNIPVTPTIPAHIAPGSLPENLPGAVQGVGYGKHRYRGPKPPFRWSHRYQFNLYVLDCELELPASTKKRALITAMKGHILQQAALVGHYR